MNFGEGPYVEIGESEDVFGVDMSNDDEEECQNRPLHPNLSFQSLANLIWYDSGSHHKASRLFSQLAYDKHPNGDISHLRRYRSDFRTVGTSST